MAEDQVQSAMSLHPHWGHTDVLEALAKAWDRDSLPAALLIQGPRGVGKQHLALWLGRLLLCKTATPKGPCETCKSCRLARKLEHPDLHWYFPLPRPKNASTPEKLSRALAESREEVLTQLRRDPLQPFSSSEPSGLYLAAAQTLREQARRRPFMGDRQVFIIAEAEALAPQNSSPDAANALLKLLEEPPPDTTLILTSGEPGRLLPTIRSRTTPLHLPPLRTEEVISFLREVKGVEEDEADRIGRLSHGAIGRALRLLPEYEGSAPLERVRLDALQLLKAAISTKREVPFQTSLTFKSTGARGLLELMDFLEEWLRDLALASSGEKGKFMNPESETFFQKVLAVYSIQPPQASATLEAVARARIMASGNANPQLLVFGLIQEIRQCLLGDQGAGTLER